MTKQKTKWEVLYSCTLVVLLIATTILRLPVLWLVAAIVPAFFKPHLLLPVYFISSFASTYFVVQAGLGMGRVIGTVFILFTLAHQIIYRQNSNKTLTTFLALLTVLISCSSMAAGGQYFHNVIKFIHFFLVVHCCTQLRHLNIQTLSQSLAIGSLILLVFMYTNLWDTLSDGFVHRLSINDEVNQNRFGMMLAQLVAIFAARIYLNHTFSGFSALLTASVVAAIILIIFSGSRSALLASLFPTGILIAKVASKHKWFAFTSTVFFATMLSTFSYYLSQITTSTPLLERFTVNSIQSSGGSQTRFEIWSQLVPHTVKNAVFFGNGFGAENVIALGEKFMLSKPAHNLIIDLFLQLGLIGSAIFIFFFCFTGQTLWRIRQFPEIILPFFLAGTAFVNGFGETVFTERLFWNNIGLVFACSALIKGDNEAY